MLKSKGMVEESSLKEVKAPGNKNMKKEIRKDDNIFIEPHLKNRLKIGNNRIRFHGCKAVRHDDHIHFQSQWIFCRNRAPLGGGG